MVTKSFHFNSKQHFSELHHHECINNNKGKLFWPNVGRQSKSVHRDALRNWLLSILQHFKSKNSIASEWGRNKILIQLLNVQNFAINLCHVPSDNFPLEITTNQWQIMWDSFNWSISYSGWKAELWSVRTAYRFAKFRQRWQLLKQMNLRWYKPRFSTSQLDWKWHYWLINCNYYLRIDIWHNFRHIRVGKKEETLD